MRVVAYTYEADVHCVACTKERFGKHKLAHKPSAPHDYDEHGIDYKQEDGEGNLIHPVFSTDETDFTHCGDCHEDI